MENQKKLEEMKEGAEESLEPSVPAEEPQAEEPAETVGAEEPKADVPDAETPAADGEGDKPDEPAAEQPNGEAREGEDAKPQAPQERTFTQEQVNELVGKARAEGRRKGYEQARVEARQRYGVDDDDTLDELFANGSRYGELNQRYADAGNSLKEAKTELALVKSNILPERQSDVKAILAANGLDVTEDNIMSMLPTHPEWRAQATDGGEAPMAPAPEIPQPKKPEEGGPIQKLGVEPSPKANAEEDERAKAMRLFGFGK